MKKPSRPFLWKWWSSLSDSNRLNYLRTLYVLRKVLKTSKQVKLAAHKQTGKYRGVPEVNSGHN